LGLASAVAAETEKLQSLTLEQALALAEQRNPTLRAQAQTIESSRAGEITAGLRPNPTFQNDTTSASLGIYQEFEVGGKRRARLESAPFSSRTRFKSTTF